LGAFAVAALLSVLAGCTTTSRGGPIAPSPTPTTAGARTTEPQPIDTFAAGPLCALLSGQDFHEVAGLPIGRTQGGGTDNQATCEYGPHLELIVSVSDDTAAARASYRAMVASGWFASNVKRSPVAGVDESTYGNGPEAAAISLRRAKLVLTITVPGEHAEPPLAQLAGRALARASTLGTA
jgi:hypothetical protein